MNNSVYQDGIKLPITTSSIAPIGVTRAKANFTGPSRVELNVSRNAVNESPDLLKLWAHEVGLKIQQQALSVIKDTLSFCGIETWNENDIWVIDNKKRDLLSDYTKREILEFLLRK